ncbi:unnamed protein product, partial [marine sediment metagenome]
MYSSSNTISGNTVLGNYRNGIRLYYSNSNTIFHNNFIDNTVQVIESYSTNTWDNGAGEGNYWSDYRGSDNDGDGIGDTSLPHKRVDWYPFMYEIRWEYGTTPMGTNVPVLFPEEGTTLIFQEVISGGTTTCTVTETGPPPPTGFRLVPSPPPTYYQITTTATYTGLITIRINYDDSGLTSGQENNLNLRQYDEATSEWVVIT